MSVDLSGPLRNEFEKAKLAYKKACETKEADAAARQAERCGRFLRLLAENIPTQARFYLETAARWEELAKTIRKEGLKEPPERDGQSDNTVKTPAAKFKEYIEGLVTTSEVTWDDVASLEEPKQLLRESVAIAAMKKPKGVMPWQGILLYGVPGTGKSLLAAAAAGSLRATFFDADAASMRSKWYGESPQLIAALYDVARIRAPSIVFLDEVDALARSRDSDLHEATRDSLSTLLTQLDGLKNKQSGRFVLTLVGTNKPQDLDSAVLSRFPLRIYVPLPDANAAAAIAMIHTRGLDASRIDFKSLGRECERRLFSGRDIKYLCQGAMMNMIREANPDLAEKSGWPIEELTRESLNTRPLVQSDLDAAFQKVQPPPTIKEDLDKLLEWRDSLGK